MMNYVISDIVTCYVNMCRITYGLNWEGRYSSSIIIATVVGMLVGLNPPSNHPHVIVLSFKRLPIFFPVKDIFWCVEQSSNFVSGSSMRVPLETTFFISFGKTPCV